MGHTAKRRHRRRYRARHRAVSPLRLVEETAKHGRLLEWSAAAISRSVRVRLEVSGDPAPSELVAAIHAHVEAAFRQMTMLTRRPLDSRQGVDLARRELLAWRDANPRQRRPSLKSLHVGGDGIVHIGVFLEPVVVHGRFGGRL